MTEVGSIDILNNINVNNNFTFNQDYYYTLQFRRKNKEILANAQVLVDLQVLHYPSHLVCYGIFNPRDIKNLTFKSYEQISSNTDENGKLIVK